MNTRNSSNTPNSTFISSTFLAALYCPLTKKVYENPQTLNCVSKCTFSLEPIYTLFGALKEAKCEKPNLCPKCKTEVTSYWSNTSLENLVKAILNPEFKEIEHTEEKITPFPFAPSTFMLQKETYDFMPPDYESPYFDITLVTPQEEAFPFVNIQLYIHREKQISEFKYAFTSNFKDIVTTAEFNQMLHNMGIQPKTVQYSVYWDTNDAALFASFIQLIIKYNNFKNSSTDLNTLATLQAFLIEVERGQP